MLPNCLSLKNSIKSIVAPLLQTRTIAVEEFWGPDGFCSCSLFWYEDRVKCCPIFHDKKCCPIFHQKFSGLGVTKFSVRNSLQNFPSNRLLHCCFKYARISGFWRPRRFLFLFSVLLRKRARCCPIFRGTFSSHAT